MILGIIDKDGGKLDLRAREMLTMARGLAEELGEPLAAVNFSSSGETPIDALQTFGVTLVYNVQHDRFDRYAPEAWAQSVVQLTETLSPGVVIGTGSDRGNELLAHASAILDLPMAANCTEINPGEPFRLTRVRWGGSLLEEATLSGRIKLLTVAPNSVTPEETLAPESCQMETFRPSLDDKAFRVQLTEKIKTAGDKVSLAEARVVVGGGRGVGSAEGFSSLEELADLLGGAVGGSRVVTNLGWRPHSDQIGQTGTRIAPDLYIACGISGAIQHMVGCKGAKYILAINKDGEAPIMQKADYAVIGDLHEVVPALIAELKG